MINNSGSKLYMLLIILAGTALGYLYYIQVAKPAEAVIPPPPISNSDDLRLFQDLKIDFALLNNPILGNPSDKLYLNIFGEVPVNPGVTGKQDVFAP